MPRKIFLFLVIIFGVYFCVHAQEHKTKINLTKNSNHTKKIIKKSQPNIGAPNGGGTYDPKTMYGEPVFDKNNKLKFIGENKLQLALHKTNNCIFLNISGFSKRAQKYPQSKIRIAAWDRKDIYAQEGVKPFRASGYLAKNLSEPTRFRLCGFELGKKYSFFAHLDQTHNNKVDKNMFGPTELLVFSNSEQETNKQAPGLKVKWFLKPDFEKTLRTFTHNGQVISLKL